MCGILCLISNVSESNSNFLKILQNLQHRGQDSFGYGFLVDTSLKTEVSNSLIKNFSIQKFFKSNVFLGHTRYTTSGSKNNNSSQPIIDKFKFGEFMFVFNGNIPLDNTQKEEFNLDTELIRKFLIKNSEIHNTIDELLIFFIRSFPRAYSIILYCNNNIYAFKDRYGVRPLSYRINTTQQNLLLSSEFQQDSVEIEAGELIKFNNLQKTSVYKYGNISKASCLFEYIYFMNENTIWYDHKVKNVREEFGILLAKNDYDNFNNKDYIVIGIPQSGIPSGKAYAKHLNLQYKQLIEKNRKVQRTFILKDNTERTKISNKKYIFNKELSGKKIIIIDDSIVRGITLKTLISNLKLQDVKEIHVRIAAPEIKFTCQYGIDIPEKNELLVNRFKDNKEIVENFKCNSLKFINLDEVKKNNILKNFNDLCTGCFNNNYKDLEW